jgi:hypothetical protein
VHTLTPGPLRAQEPRDTLYTGAILCLKMSLQSHSKERYLNKPTLVTSLVRLEKVVPC